MYKKFDFSELKSIIELNSYTKNKSGVDKNGDIFSKWMEDLGFEIKSYNREDIGNHLLFTSKKRKGKKVLLLGHLDTVFTPNTFKNFTEDEEWIYGPGVCDMKGGNYIALQALRKIKERYGEITNIDMFLVSDEETGSDDSRFISMELAKNYDYCLVYEAAGENGEVVVGRKGVGTFFIEIIGKAAHAGNNYSNGINANLEAAHKLIALTALTNLKKETTVNVGKIDGGIGANTISPTSQLVVEIRYTNIKERDRVLKEMQKIVDNNFVKGVTTVFLGGIQRDVMQPSNMQSHFLDQIKDICGEKLLTEKRGGVSDANIISSHGVITLDGFGPFGDGDHTIEERASKKSFIERIDLSEKILSSFMEDKF